MPHSDEKHGKALKLWTPGTCNWINEQVDFKSWTEEPGSVLWLNGIRKSALCHVKIADLTNIFNAAGSGKTILM